MEISEQRRKELLKLAEEDFITTPYPPKRQYNKDALTYDVWNPRTDKSVLPPGFPRRAKCTL